MTGAEADKLASELLSGTLSEEEEREARAELAAVPEGQAALARMEAAVAALQAWPASLPAVEIPQPRKRRSLAPWFFVPLTAAASVLIAVVLLWPHDADRTPESKMPFVAGKKSDDHTGSPKTNKPGLGRVDEMWATSEFASLFKGRGGSQGGGGNPPFGGDPKGKEGGDGGPGNLPGGSKGGANPYRRLVDFDFELPQLLPEKFKLVSGAASSKKRLRLIYKSGKRTLLVHLKASSGKDVPAGLIKPPPGHKPAPIFATRLDGLGIAMEGKGVDADFVNKNARGFVPAKKP